MMRKERGEQRERANDKEKDDLDVSRSSHVKTKIKNNCGQSFTFNEKLTYLFHPLDMFL